MRYTLLLTLLLPVGAIAAAESDYKPLIADKVDVAGPQGNLDVTSRHFGILKAADPRKRRLTLLIEGESEPKEWALAPGAELWCDGWWARLDEFTVGDRVWVWFEKDGDNQPVKVVLLADELSEQNLYAPFCVKAVSVLNIDDDNATLETTRGSKAVVRTVKLVKAEMYRGDAKAPLNSLKLGEAVHVQTTGEDARLILDREAFEKRRAAQVARLRRRWADEGLPGTLIFSHPERLECEIMLDHEAMRWGRSLVVGDNVTLEADPSMPAVVRGIRPWRERTQVLLAVDGRAPSKSMAGRHVLLKLVGPPAYDDEELPPGLGKSRSKVERVEWLMSSVYCTCGMHDGCAGHFYTLAACNAGPSEPCGMAKRTRIEIADLIDKDRTDLQIFEEFLKQRGPKLLRPHMMP